MLQGVQFIKFDYPRLTNHPENLYMFQNNYADTRSVVKRLKNKNQDLYSRFIFCLYCYLLIRYREIEGFREDYDPV